MTIIVGTDGTSRGTAAVVWAAAEAQRRRTLLRILYAFDPERDDSRFEIGNEYLDVATILADAVVADARRRACAAAPDVDLETDTLIGHAVPRLLDVARGAQLLVLGDPARSGRTGLVLGSTCRRLTRQAPCPVVVVRGRAVAGGPVIAGIDDSADADLVAEVAFEAAADRGCDLLVLRSLAPARPRRLAGIRRAGRPAAQERTAELARIEDRLAAWRDKHPGVRVEVALTRDTAAAALAARSGRAQLVVIGSSGHRAVGGTILGSVGQHLLHHAACPVLIARACEPA